MRLRLGCAFSCLLLASSTMAGTLDPLLGKWQCQGGVNGREASVLMLWEPALGGKFVRLMWRNDLRNEDGTQRFEGDAYYLASDDSSLVGTWFDSQGSRHNIQATMEAKILTSVWSNEATTGRTRYTLTDIGMEIEDAIRSGEEWRVFGRVSCERM